VSPRAATVETLEGLLARLVQPERLDEGNLWLCDRCGKRSRAVKADSLRRLPDVLIVLLKRFTSDLEKISTTVFFPTRDLDLSAHVGGAPSSLVYDLFAVLNHYGSYSHGHYTAFVAHDGLSDSEPASSWVEIDDARARVVDVIQLVSAAAYVLFFRRRRSVGSAPQPAGPSFAAPFSLDGGARDVSPASDAEPQSSEGSAGASTVPPLRPQARDEPEPSSMEVVD